MLKRLGLLLLAGMLAGCQTDAVSQNPAPSLAPPTIGAPARATTPASYDRIARNDRRTSPRRVPAQSAVPRAWIPQTQARAWKYIVVHHSDTRVGCAASFDRAHRARGWECLGYDFVIGNGTQSGDGQIEVGQRWVRQMDGAHAGVKEYNVWGIGICLVGNFEVTRPTSAQMQSLAKLVGYLERIYHIPPERVIGHRDAKQGRTRCPGRYMDLNVVRRMAAQYSGVAEWMVPNYAPLALDGELLHDIATDSDATPPSADAGTAAPR